MQRLGWFSLALLMACGGGEKKPPPRPRHETPYDAGPAPQVELDASAPRAAPTPAYLAERARARAFAEHFTWSKKPSLDQAPKEQASYGGVGAEAFAIARVEIWVKKGEFSVRAVTGGVERCLGPEIVIRGALETKTYDMPFDVGRGYFQAPRGGAERDDVPFVETTSYQAPSATVLEIQTLARDSAGHPKAATGRFVTMMEGRAPIPRMWAVSTFVEAAVTVFDQ